MLPKSVSDLIIPFDEFDVNTNILYEDKDITTTEENSGVQYEYN
jgi:hypothetical protein